MVGPVLASLIMVSARRADGGLRVGVLAGAVLMMSASLLALPHTILQAVIMVVSRFTGAAGPFDLQPHWLSSVAHLANLVAVTGVVGWLVVDRRTRTERCPWCGAGPDQVMRPLLGRTGLRTVGRRSPSSRRCRTGCSRQRGAWAGRGGVVGPGFEQVHFASPGFGDTAILAGYRSWSARRWPSPSASGCCGCSV